MMISFRLNKKNDNELISLLSKYENNNMSEFIRNILRDSLLTNKNNNIVEDVFAEDMNSNLASNMGNVKFEVEQINKKVDISNSSNNKTKVIIWNNPNLK